MQFSSLAVSFSDFWKCADWECLGWRDPVGGFTDWRKERSSAWLSFSPLVGLVWGWRWLNDNLIRSHSPGRTIKKSQRGRLARKAFLMALGSVRFRRTNPKRPDSLHIDSNNVVDGFGRARQKKKSSHSHARCLSSSRVIYDEYKIRRLCLVGEGKRRVSQRALASNDFLGRERCSDS